jgi:hypothetical protein
MQRHPKHDSHSEGNCQRYVLTLFSSTLDAGGHAGEGRMETPREHLRFAIAFALSRLPKEWLRRLQREHVTDKVARRLLNALALERPMAATFLLVMVATQGKLG